MQTRSYIGKLTRGIEAVVVGRGAFKDMTALHPGLRMVHCEHHYVFCLPPEAAPGLVVAILHERMDLITRLEARLN